MDIYCSLFEQHNGAEREEQDQTDDEENDTESESELGTFDVLVFPNDV